MINHITSDEIRKNKDKYILLDVREDHERAKDGFIPKSEHINGSSLDVYKLSDFFKNNNNKHIVIYCNSGIRSQSLVEVVVKNKLYYKDKISNLKGGFQIWKASSYEIEYL